MNTDDRGGGATDERAKQRRDSGRPGYVTTEDEGNPECRLHYDCGQLQSLSRYDPAHDKSTIKYNLAVKVGDLTNRHKTHREVRDMGNNGNKEAMGEEVTNRGDMKRGIVSNANSSDVRWRATPSK